MSMWLDDARRLGRFRSSLDRLFSDFLAGAPHGGTDAPHANPVFPALNCWEDENGLYAECELPGVAMDDLEIAVTGRDLTLKGQRSAEAVAGATYHRRERDAGLFHRVVHLPVDVDAANVKAVLKNGVLTIELPKAPEAKPRKIEVKCVTK